MKHKNLNKILNKLQKEYIHTYTEMCVDSVNAHNNKIDYPEECETEIEFLGDSISIITDWLNSNTKMQLIENVINEWLKTRLEKHEKRN